MRLRWMTRSEWECKEKARRSGMPPLLIKESQAKHLAIVLTYGPRCHNGDDRVNRHRTPPSCAAVFVLPATIYCDGELTQNVGVNEYE
jgi:hypothetical protein